ncbi:DUF3135 domain-containing protein [Shewanella sp. NIFS-20-20]|uniref:DUF3135 domain-containing protein n=1 Tax=Shewanella sp. NIFS-20-20 TaxID=2853806 RepID=UPI001C463FA3|nr:DUF3135 domain-containing protein [Shewanella sp. NIFS-20-20]MBV7317221.1 DUF3135 domain-containing protein [Shewanella sp. NIFS-20-20]
MTDLPDFDTLKRMAENEPDKLAKLQETLMDELIESSGKNKEQLLSLKHHYQHKMSLCNNPYQRCVVAMTMMRNKLVTLSNVLNQPADFKATTATVIDFPTQQDQAQNL